MRLKDYTKVRERGETNWGVCLGSSTSWSPHCSPKDHMAGGEEQSWCQTQNKLPSPQWDMGCLRHVNGCHVQSQGLPESSKRTPDKGGWYSQTGFWSVSMHAAVPSLSPSRLWANVCVSPHYRQKVIKLKLHSLQSWNLSTSLLNVKSVKLSETFPVAHVEWTMRMFVEGWAHLPWPSTPSFHGPFLRKLRGDRSRLVCPGLRSWLLWSGGRRCSQV